MTLKAIKVAVLSGSRRLGLFSAVGRSQWRTTRLLVLAYHGISQHDEHLWNPALYMSPEALRRRFELLSRNQCSVLPLAEAMARLARNDLPPRAVVLTFDDGAADFFTQAYPLIKEWGYPVTVYQTSFYSRFNRPVFDVACSYILWKARGRIVGQMDLRTAKTRADAAFHILSASHRDAMSAEDKDDLLHDLARSLSVDVEPIRAGRLLHLMTPDELRAIIRDGADVQLHTHRHRMPVTRELFAREIEDNRSFLRDVGQPNARHFCYPDGRYGPQFLPWLTELGVESATTCVPGLATPLTTRLLCPRLIDSSNLSEVEFEGWLHGLSDVLPRRPVAPSVLPYDVKAWA